MKRFCTACGKEANPGDKVCIHCGTKLPSEDIEEKVSENKKVKKGPPMPKKKKILFSVIGAVVVLVIAFSMWAQSYQSPDAVQKRFAKAISEKDASKVQTLLVHEDGSSVTKGEVTALLKLVDEEGTSVVDDLFSVDAHGKFIFLFTAHKVEAVDQFAAYKGSVEGLSFLFNGKAIPEYHADKEEIVYGPLVPGDYQVEAVFEGEYGKTKKEDTIALLDSYGDETWLDMDVNVSKVVFHVDNHDEFDAKKSFIKLGDEKVSIDKEGKTKSIGPFILDGSEQVQTVVTMPWGEVESKPIDIDASEMTLHADLLSKKQFTGLEETLKNFGEQYVESMASKSTKPLKAVTDDVKTVVEEMMDEDYYYSGKFEKVEIDRNSVQVDNSAKQPQIEILTAYTFNEAYHDLDADPDFYEEVPRLSLNLSYDEDKKAWKILSVEESDYWGDFVATDTAEGSKELYSPGKEAVAKAKSDAVKEDITYFMKAYTQDSVNAINYSDFSYVEDHIVPDSPRWSEAKDYIDYLESKDITEDLLDLEIQSVEETGDNTWEVTVIESFTIYKSDSSSDKEFKTKVIVKKVDDEYMVYELIETNEI